MVVGKMAGGSDYYKVLGVHRNATEKDLKKAYKTVSLVHIVTHQKQKNNCISRLISKKYFFLVFGLIPRQRMCVIITTQLARQHHPDKNPAGDASGAGEVFKVSRTPLLLLCMCEHIHTLSHSALTLTHT